MNISIGCTCSLLAISHYSEKHIASCFFKEHTLNTFSFPSFQLAHVFHQQRGLTIKSPFPFRSINLFITQRRTILHQFGFTKLSASKKIYEIIISRVSNLFLKHISVDLMWRETNCTGEIEQRCRYNVDLCSVWLFKNMNIQGREYIHIKSIYCDAMCSAVLPNCLAR